MSLNKDDKQIAELINRFPEGEQALKNITMTNFEKSIFVIKRRDDVNVINVPKNLESFADSRLMIAVVRLLDAKGFKILRSETECPVKVLQSSQEDWFVGYVNAFLAKGGSKAELGTSKYARGFHAYQSAAIKASLGKGSVLDHLKLSSDTPGNVLAKMDNFTKEWWGLRANLSGLFKLIEPTGFNGDLSSFLKSFEELTKDKIRKTLPYDNGGVFTASERAWFTQAYEEEASIIDKMRDRLKSRDEALAKFFTRQFEDYNKAIKKIDSHVKPIVALRARILFPSSKKKKDVLWSKKPLDEKLPLLERNQLVAFSPKQLSKTVIRAPISHEHGMRDKSLNQLYGVDEEEISEELGAVLRDWTELILQQEEET